MFPARRPGKAIDIASVELKLSNHADVAKKVDPSAQSVQFELELPAGPVDIEAWLIGPDGKRQGAYFVYVEQLWMGLQHSRRPVGRISRIQP